MHNIIIDICYTCIYWYMAYNACKILAHFNISHDYMCKVRSVLIDVLRDLFDFLLNINMASTRSPEMTNDIPEKIKV